MIFLLHDFVTFSSFGFINYGGWWMRMILSIIKHENQKLFEVSQIISTYQGRHKWHPLEYDRMLSRDISKTLSHCKTLSEYNLG